MTILGLDDQDHSWNGEYFLKKKKWRNKEKMSSFQWFPMIILEAQFAPSYQLDSISDGSGIFQIGFLGAQK